MWALPANTTISAVRCETDQAIDDVLLLLANGGFVYIQAKTTVSLSDKADSPLRAAIEGYLAASGARTTPMPKAVIAPHSGYVYSGPVAGHAFAALGDGASAMRRAVVLGPAHFVPFRGIAVPSAAAFHTPLGDVPLDGEAIEGIRDLPQVQVADGPHRPEHALEVELPVADERGQDRHAQPGASGLVRRFDRVESESAIHAWQSRAQPARLGDLRHRLVETEPFVALER